MMRARILIVDDDHDNADSLARLVKILDYEAITAYSGQQAIAAVRDLGPEMALIDIEMPLLDGYETAKRIRRLGRSIVLVAVSGWARKEDKLRATDAGFDLHYSKPLSLNSLEDLLAVAEANCLAGAD